jgi:hypothetical protein
VSFEVRRNTEKIMAMVTKQSPPTKNQGKTRLKIETESTQTAVVSSAEPPASVDNVRLLSWHKGGVDRGGSLEAEHANDATVGDKS